MSLAIDLPRATPTAQRQSGSTRTAARTVPSSMAPAAFGTIAAAMRTNGPSAGSRTCPTAHRTCASTSTPIGQRGRGRGPVRPRRRPPAPSAHSATMTPPCSSSIAPRTGTSCGSVGGGRWSARAAAPGSASTTATTRPAAPEPATAAKAAATASETAKSASRTRTCPRRARQRRTRGRICLDRRDPVRLRELVGRRAQRLAERRRQVRRHGQRGPHRSEGAVRQSIHYHRRCRRPGPPCLCTKISDTGTTSGTRGLRRKASLHLRLVPRPSSSARRASKRQRRRCRLARTRASVRRAPRRTATRTLRPVKALIRRRWPGHRLARLPRQVPRGRLHRRPPRGYRRPHRGLDVHLD